MRIRSRRRYTSFVQKLKDDGGYSTAIFGKWHLAGLPSATSNYPGMKPKEAGFDLFKGNMHAAIKTYWDYDYMVQDAETPANQWRTGTPPTKSLPGIAPTTFAPVVQVADTLEWITAQENIHARQAMVRLDGIQPVARHGAGAAKLDGGAECRYAGCAESGRDEEMRRDIRVGKRRILQWRIPDARDDEFSRYHRWQTAGEGRCPRSEHLRHRSRRQRHSDVRQTQSGLHRQHVHHQERSR